MTTPNYDKHTDLAMYATLDISSVGLTLSLNDAFLPDWLTLALAPLLKAELPKMFEAVQRDYKAAAKTELLSEIQTLQNRIDALKAARQDL